MNEDAVSGHIAEMVSSLAKRLDESGRMAVGEPRLVADGLKVTMEVDTIPAIAPADVAEMQRGRAAHRPSCRATWWKPCSCDVAFSD